MRPSVSSLSPPLSFISRSMLREVLLSYLYGRLFNGEVFRRLFLRHRISNLALRFGAGEQKVGKGDRPLFYFFQFFPVGSS